MRSGAARESVHTAWLGMLRPEGLVVSVPVLEEAGAWAEQPSSVSAAIRELAPGRRLDVDSFWALLTEVLRWPEARLLRGEALAGLEVDAPDLGGALRPDAALLGHGGEPLILVRWSEGPLDRGQGGPAPSAVLDRLLTRNQRPGQDGVRIGLLGNPETLRLVYAPRGEAPGALSFPVEALVSADGRILVSPVVAIRFLSACKDGHLWDIDWQGFVHKWERCGPSGEWCAPRQDRDPELADFAASLWLQQRGTSGDLTDLVLYCRSCGASRGLQELAAPGALGDCHGIRPWLGYGGREPCENKARLVTRTASNIYFPVVASALQVDDPADALRSAVALAWPFLETADAASLPVLRRVPMAARHLEGWSDAALLAEIERRRAGLPVERVPLREPEVAALHAAPDEVPGELPRPGERWHARRVRPDDLPPFIERLVLVKHLTEVRAQLGFTRIEPDESDAEGEYDLKPHTAPLALNADWLPAVRIQGEGLYLALDPAAVDRWAARPVVRDRERAFQLAIARHSTLQRDDRAPLIDARLVLIHTLSHLLLTSLALDCGYAASSLRERLYCSSHPNPRRGQPGQPDRLTERAGILLYTGTPGSEGTLGGLIAQGRRLAHHLRRAAELGMLCSNDPVCAQHQPGDGQEGRHREGAACHGCVLIGEPSCERRNLDLDRTLVVPTVEEGRAAFLGEWVRGW